MRKVIGSATRRDFLKTAAGGIALPWIVPSLVRGANAPSNRIVAAAIGVGGMGRGNLNGFLGRSDVQVVAVCDVDSNHLNSARDMVNKKYGNKDCRTYKDFRELLAKERPDVVLHALPDHWHATIAVRCAESGCDMYGEKPLARSIREGRAMANAVHQYGRVWQTGSWQRSRGHFHRGCELVRNGVIGKIQYVEVGLPRARGPLAVQPVKAPPSTLDWDFWLGPAPERAYCDFGGRGVHFDWRWIMDYSGGQLTDWAGHHIDIAHWGLGFDDTGPEEIEGSADYPVGTLYDVPTKFKFTCTYKGGLKVHVADSFPMGAKWYGENGWIHVSRRGMWASNPALLKTPTPPDGVHLYRSTDHIGNFVDCVKSRQLTVTPVETALRSISVGLLGEIAMRTGRKIRWNPETEEILNDPGASALLGRAYRGPWTL